MTKFRTICLNFVRWRERRAWQAYLRWQRAGWRLHGYRGVPVRDAGLSARLHALADKVGVPKPAAMRDGVAGTFDEPPPGWHEEDGKAVRDGDYFLRPGWRDVEVKGAPTPGPMVDNVRKAGGA